MKRLSKMIYFIIIILICGCDRVNYNNKKFIYKNKFEYNFISNSIVQYKNIKDNYIINCRYKIETTNMIKVICNDDVKLLLYDKDNNCLYDHNSRVYCIK